MSVRWARVFAVVVTMGIGLAGATLTVSADGVSVQLAGAVVPPTVLRPSVEPALAAAVGVVDQLSRCTATGQGHAQSLHRQFGAELVGHGPAHYPARVAV
ncbi:MAG TPA: hypothetical protein VNF24_07700 [Candidatus Acidoferrales bacterium]|nr:hypothetical protein [Candidatus Acidoferrales bacterium]